jgi:elongation factor 1 alpha-like protein
VFKGQGSTTGVWGRVCSGIVQVGECLRVLPGDETAVVKGCSLPFLYSMCLTGANRVYSDRDGDGQGTVGHCRTSVTLYLTEIDPIHLDTGRVLCPQTHPVELASAFTARIIVFDIQVPILAGTSVSELPSATVASYCKSLTTSVDRAFPSFS